MFLFPLDQSEWTLIYVHFLPHFCLTAGLLGVSLLRFCYVRRQTARFDPAAPFRSEENRRHFSIRMTLNWLGSAVFLMVPVRCFLAYEKSRTDFEALVLWVFCVRETWLFLAESGMLWVNIWEWRAKTRQNFKLLFFHHFSLLLLLIAEAFVLNDEASQVFKVVSKRVDLTLKLVFLTSFLFCYLIKLFAQPDFSRWSQLNIPLLATAVPDPHRVEPFLRLVTKTGVDKIEFTTFSEYLVVGKSSHSTQEIQLFLEHLYQTFCTDELALLAKQWALLADSQLSQRFGQTILHRPVYFCPEVAQFFGITDPRVSELFDPGFQLLEQFYTENTHQLRSLRFKYPKEDIWRCYPYFSVGIDHQNSKITGLDLTVNLMITFRGPKGVFVAVKPANAVVNEILIFETQSGLPFVSRSVQELEKTLNIMINERYYRYKMHSLFWGLPSNWGKAVDPTPEVLVADSPNQTHLFLTPLNKFFFVRTCIYPNGLEKTQTISRDLWDLQVLLDALAVRKDLAEFVPQGNHYPREDPSHRVSVATLMSFLERVARHTAFLDILEVRLFLLVF